MDQQETSSPDPAEQDLEWVRRAQAGDEAAFGELMQFHYEVVFRRVFAIVRDEHGARDACQEVWLKVWRNLGAFRGEAKFTTWLHSIVVRQAIDHLRKRRRWSDRWLPLRSELEPDDAARGAAHEPVDPDPDPGERTEMAERKLRFERALAALPAKHRAVLALREVEGLSYEEIARAVKCPTGTVMSRLYHARRLLMRKLEDLACD